MIIIKTFISFYVLVLLACLLVSLMIMVGHKDLMAKWPITCIVNEKLVIGITHIFSCNSICWFSGMLFEHETVRPSV